MTSHSVSPAPGGKIDLVRTRPGGATSPRFEPRDHICALVSGPDQRDAIMRPFVSEGMHANHKCLLGLAESDPWPTVRSYLPGSDLESLCSAHQLDVFGTPDRWRAPAELSIPEMLEFWGGVVDEAQAHGYAGTRVTAEARWWCPQLPHTEALLDYESSLNGFATERDAAILCIYDLEDHGWMLMDLMRTHPRILINGVEFDNPYYTAPDEARVGRL